MSLVKDEVAIHWNKLTGKTILVTGANGLIGRNIIKAIIDRNQSSSEKVGIIGLVRNYKKVQNNLLSDVYNEVKFVEGDIKNFTLGDQVSFIIHCASPTDSGFMVTHPVETINDIFMGTQRVLELAWEQQVEGVVYISSMEVYGGYKDDTDIYEDGYSTVDTSQVRSSYPEAKRLAENMCIAFSHEYGVPVNIIRLAQTFDPNIAQDDNRLFAQIINSIEKGENIVLSTEGKSKRCYIYISDAIRGILTVLTSDVHGEIYNLANSKTYCSIRELAEMIAKKYGIQVVVDKQNMLGNTKKYPKESCLKLNSDKIENLGWAAKVSLDEMFWIALQQRKNLKR